MKKISCIIAALNEEKQIAAVLDATLEASKTIPMEIIVIDDGSTDQTPKILKKYKSIKVLTNKRNMGKSYAVARGFEEANGDYILLLDADLIGLNADNIHALIAPVKKGVADVTISIRKDASIVMRKMNLDYVSGERVFPRKLIAAHIKEIKKLPNFSLEVFINNLTIENDYNLATVYWSNVANHFKYKKRGFFVGLFAEFKMFLDILKIVPLSELVRHNIALRKLLINK
jgi:glycosyltransferase involved in cell wall biosynthesis